MWWIGLWMGCVGSGPVDSDAVDSDTGDTADSEDTADTVETADTDVNLGPVIYVTVVSHNEQPNTGVPESDPAWHPNYVTDPAFYEDNRAAVLELAEELYNRGVTWNLQSDGNWLDAVADNDELNDNVALELQDSWDVQIDVHHHPSFYNDADVAFAMEELGVNPSDVVGGFVYSPVEEANWEDFEVPIDGQVSEHTWTGRWLWGAATPSHAGEDDHSSGIWRPQDAANFYTHDPDQVLAVIGNCSITADGVLALSADLDDGGAPSDGFYPAAVMFDQQDLDDAKIADILAAVDSLEGLVDAGRVRWAHLTEISDHWTTDYEGEPSRFDCSPYVDE